MPQPELKANDIFYMIGFTNQDVLSGSHHQLQKRLGILPHLPPVEVYSLDAVTAPDRTAFKLHGNFLAVYFLSEAALTLAKEHGIQLPPVMGTIIRKELPLGVSTFIGPTARGKSASD
jgi:hypothetical protein